MNQALEEARDQAKLSIGRDFGKAQTFFAKLNGRELDEADYAEMPNNWQILMNLRESTDDLEDTDQVVADLMRINNENSDVSEWNLDDKQKYIRDTINQFTLSVFSEKLKKNQNRLLKIHYSVINTEDEILTFDSAQAWDPLKEMQSEDVDKRMRWVETSEDGISRTLEEEKRDRIVVSMRTNGMPPTQEDKEKDERIKYLIFKHGVVDVSTGKHYMVCFQSPSANRKNDFTFVEMNDIATSFDLWAKVTGFASFKDLCNPKAGLIKKDGTTQMAKLIARTSTRGSSSFNVMKIADDKWVDDIRNLSCKYVGDVEETIHRPWMKMVGPGNMQMTTEERTVTPGDGEGLMSYSASALFAVSMRIISKNEYDEFCGLWNDAKKDIRNVKMNSKLGRLIQKIPCVFQIRHGEKKGLLVRANMEAYDEVGSHIVIPDSVRKFIAGEWSDFPLEILNWSKQKGEWVCLNPQVIQSLQYENPNALIPIAEYWLIFMEESIGDTVKAQEFHNIIRNSDEDDNPTDDSVSMMMHAIRTSDKLIKEAQVCNWRSAQYEKFISDMTIGRIRVPGMYTYMVCDPNYLLNRYFGLNIPCLKEDQFYLNDNTCECGLFRAPLIHPSESQKVQLVHKKDYWAYKDVIIFNGFDGTWDRMGGGSL